MTLQGRHGTLVMIRLVFGGVASVLGIIACRPDLVVKGPVTRWNDHEKFVGVRVENHGTRTASHVRVRFQCKTRRGATLVLDSSQGNPVDPGDSESRYV